MTQQDEQHYKALDSLEEFLEKRHKETQGKINNILRLFKEHHDWVTLGALTPMLDELIKNGSATKIVNTGNTISYVFSKKHSIGYYQQEKNKEIETEKFIQIQYADAIKEAARDKLEEKKLGLDIKNGERKIFWFYPLLITSFIGSTCGIIALGINIAKYRTEQIEKDLIETTTKSTLILKDQKKVYPNSKPTNDIQKKQSP